MTTNTEINIFRPQGDRWKHGFYRKGYFPYRNSRSMYYDGFLFPYYGPQYDKYYYYYDDYPFIYVDPMNKLKPIQNVPNIISNPIPNTGSLNINKTVDQNQDVPMSASTTEVYNFTTMLLVFIAIIIILLLTKESC